MDWSAMSTLREMVSTLSPAAPQEVTTFHFTPEEWYRIVGWPNIPALDLWRLDLPAT
jgi:hypothetical protein